MLPDCLCHRDFLNVNSEFHTPPLTLVPVRSPAIKLTPEQKVVSQQTVNAIGLDTVQVAWMATTSHFFSVFHCLISFVNNGRELNVCSNVSSNIWGPDAAATKVRRHRIFCFTANAMSRVSGRLCRIEFKSGWLF